jgi:hypothetical protein
MMFRTFSQPLLIVLTVLLTIQFVGTSCSDDCLREWPHGPLHAQDQIPSGTDGQTEGDGSQEEGELEFALAQGSGFHFIHRIRSRFVDSWYCPREAFDSGLFRPPTFSLA